MKIKRLLRLQNEKYSATAILKWLWKTSRGNRTQTILNAVIGILEVLVSLGCVYTMKYAIDKAQYHAPTTEIATAVAILAALYLINMGLRVSGTWISNILGVKAQNRMQQRILDRILHSEWNGKERLHSGDVLNRLELDVKSVISFITETIPNILSVFVLFIGAFIMLATMDIELAIIVVAIIPIAIFFSRFYIRKMRRYTRNIRESDSKIQSMLQETIQHRVLIKTLERDDDMISRLDGTQSILREQVRHRTHFSIVSHLILSIGFLSGYIIAFLHGVMQITAGLLTFGSMTAFLQLVNRIQSPARDMMRLAPKFVSVFTAAERLMELQNVDMEEQGEPIRFKGACGISLEDISFAYQSEQDTDKTTVINNLSFNFKPGTCTAVLGETGAGKTTLVRLMLALLKPENGKMTIYDDNRKEDISPRIRCNLVYVPQGNTLLSGTIRENLYLGNLNATDEDLVNALHKACADFVMDLPDGLDTQCGEGGTGLSEGQAQRIAIARALLREGNIMLLDEATSALDIETERQLLENLLENHEKTIIFITHRQAVMRYCDNTLKL